MLLTRPNLAVAFPFLANMFSAFEPDVVEQGEHLSTSFFLPQSKALRYQPSPAPHRILSIRIMPVSTTVPKLFSPIQLGDVRLGHRIVMAPLTHYRANLAHVHGDLAVEYYGQRSSIPGGLIITEATFIAQQAVGEKNVPGIWSDEQVAAWRRVSQR